MAGKLAAVCFPEILLTVWKMAENRSAGLLLWLRERAVVGSGGVHVEAFRLAQNVFDRAYRAGQRLTADSRGTTLGHGDLFRSFRGQTRSIPMAKVLFVVT